MKCSDPRHSLRPQFLSRREMLSYCANGFGMLGLAGLLSPESIASPGSETQALNPLAVRPPMYSAKAKRVIFLFMSGGPSHVDTFDPKPRLMADMGKPLPFPKPQLERTKTGNLLGSPWTFKKYGQAGTEVSELFPYLSSCVDDMCIVRGMYADNINHNGACLQMNTGEQAFSRPSMGSWLTYGLGTENQNLPGYIVISPAQPAQGAPLWTSSFLPAAYQGTLVADLKNPIDNLHNQQLTIQQQRDQLNTLGLLNEIHHRGRPEDSQLSARIASYELAFRMQIQAPAAFDVELESPETKKLYGLDDKLTETFGRQCLMARRLVERGVRMVQVYHTETSKRKSCQLWDQHGSLKEELPLNCASTDKPIAGLLKDLKSRGLLDDTLVLWGGEFGRTNYCQGQLTKDNYGRDHHPRCYCIWMAGGGIKPGTVYGETDEFGYNIIKDPVHVNDFHATVLHLMGLQHNKLVYKHLGRRYRLTDVAGQVVKGVLA